MRLALTAFAVSIAALLAGCATTVVGAAHNANVGPSSPATTSTSAQSTPPAAPNVSIPPSGSSTETFGYWTMSAAQQQYLVLADQHNSEVQALDQALCGCAGSVELLQVTDACDDLANDDQVAALAFAEDPWPSSAVPAAQALASAAKIEASGFAKCANATTTAAAQSELEHTTPAATQVAVMRAALGLPPIPTQGGAT